MKKILAIALALAMVLSIFAGCGAKAPEATNAPATNPGQETPATEAPEVEQVVLKQAEYNTTTSVMPSNWNEFTYADNNDTQIMSYIGSAFFEYDYKFEDDQKFNADGSVNKEVGMELVDAYVAYVKKNSMEETAPDMLFKAIDISMNIKLPRHLTIF